MSEKKYYDGCGNHQIIEYKTNLSMSLLGANLFGVALIAGMVAWSMLRGIPAMEERITNKIVPLTERVAKLEQWKETMEARLR